jgi:hypothetical protein
MRGLNRGQAAAVALSVGLGVLLCRIGEARGTRREPMPTSNSVVAVIRSLSLE